MPAGRRPADPPTPVGAVVRGLLAGAAGTAAMDLVWWIRYRRGGGQQGPLQWEFSARSVHDWDGVNAPGQVGKRLVEGFTQKEIPRQRAGLVNDVVHWSYGVAWGAAYGLVAGSLVATRAGGRPLRGAVAGTLFAPAVWLAGYAALPRADLYKPISEYGAATLWKDLSAHLAYGAGTGAAFAVLGGRRP